MINTRRHNPILLKRLETLAEQNDWSGMRDLLDRLSVAEFRTAGLLLAEDVLPRLTPENFWECFGEIATKNTKAHLMTFLKAAKSNGACESTRHPALRAFLENEATAIDKKKTLEALLPHLTRTTDAMELLSRCSASSPRERCEILLKSITPISFWLLFREAQHMEDDHASLRNICLQLMKRGDKLSFNLACIIQQYFGLSNLPGTFSLRLQAYELSRLNESFENFKSILLR